jgi:hypothetical protein
MGGRREEILFLSKIHQEEQRNRERKCKKRKTC